MAGGGLSVWIEEISQVQQQKLQIKKKDQVSSVNTEVRAGSVGRQCMGSLETKGSKTLYNVGDSLMALYVMELTLGL